MRVAMFCAHTCPLAPLGGWETGGMNVYVRELGRALGRRGVQVDIFTRGQACETADVVYYTAGARVVHVDGGPRRVVDKYDVLDYVPEMACGVQRWRALAGIRYDVIHSHYWLSGRLGSLFQDRWDAPMVTMFHTLAQMKNAVAESSQEREQAVRLDVERRTMAAADRIIAATNVDRDEIVRHYGHFGPLAPIRVIPGGVDLKRFRPGSKSAARTKLGIPESKVVLFVGRIQRLKGLEILVRAVGMLLSEDPLRDIRLVVVGGALEGAGYDAGELGRIRRLVGRLGMRDRVTFAGAVQQDQLPTYYQAADLTVMPSAHETFGLVAVESLASGTPVVATRVGGLPTIVRDGENGFLVPWRDPSLFADRVRQVLTQPALAGRLARAARPSVERFGWDHIAGQHLALYDEVIKEHQLRTASGMG